MTQGYGPIELTFEDQGDWVLGKVLEHRAAASPDRPFLQWQDEAALGFAETNRAVNRLAHGFAAAGVGHGDRVMILLPNCAEYVLTWFALAKLGALEVPVNSHYRGQFLEHVANTCQARLVVTDAEFLDRFAESETRLPHLERIYLRSSAGAAKPELKRLQLHDFGELVSGNDRDPGVEVAAADPVAILFTSGTTGPSKGVLMPHAQMYFFAEQCANLMRLGGDDVFMNPFPLFHGNAQFLTTYPCLIRGARAVLYERFSASEWIDRVRRNGVTVTNLLGVTMDFVFKQPARADDADNRLRVVYAAPPANAILDAFKARFGISEFVNAFGQTESCWPLMTPHGEEIPPGAVGKVVDDWYDVRLVDPETDLDVPDGEIGELVVRHRVPWTLCDGYYGNPEATAKNMRNLWWHTGDGLRRDADGWFYFIDRVNDALRVRGENVSSFEVEQVGLSHPDVAACAATSVRSDVAGGEHEIKLSVVLRPGREPDPVSLIRHFETHAPFFAVPRFVEYLDALPMTPSEKIQKHLLRKAGVGPDTWDRVAAGVELEHERKRRAQHRQKG